MSFVSFRTGDSSSSSSSCLPLSQIFVLISGVLGFLLLQDVTVPLVGEGF